MSQMTLKEILDCISIDEKICVQKFNNNDDVYYDNAHEYLMVYDDDYNAKYNDYYELISNESNRKVISITSSIYGLTNIEGTYLIIGIL